MPSLPCSHNPKVYAVRQLHPVACTFKDLGQVDKAGLCWLQNNKDYFDQSLDEIKLLKYINEADPGDEHGMLRLFDYFYYKVCYISVLASNCSVSPHAQTHLYSIWGPSMVLIVY